MRDVEVAPLHGGAVGTERGKDLARLFPTSGVRYPRLRYLDAAEIGFVIAAAFAGISTVVCSDVSVIVVSLQPV